MNSTKNYLNQFCNYKNSIFYPRYFPIDDYNPSPCPDSGGEIDKNILIIYDGGSVGGWEND